MPKHTHFHLSIQDRGCEHSSQADVPIKCDQLVMLPAAKSRRAGSGSVYCASLYATYMV